MPPSPKVRSGSESGGGGGGDGEAKVAVTGTGNFKIISNVAAGSGQRTVMKTNQIKSFHNLTVTTQERRPVLVDTPISLRGNKGDGGKPGVGPGAGGGNHQVYHPGLVTSTATSTTAVASLPKATILMPSGHYALLNTGVKGGALVAQGGSSPMHVTNVVVKTTPATPVGTQPGASKGAGVGTGQPTHFQYLVPSVTHDGKLIIMSTDAAAAKQLTVAPVSSAAGVRMVQSTVVTAADSGVIKPVTVANAKPPITSQGPTPSQGVMLISGSRPAGQQLGTTQAVSLTQSPYQTLTPGMLHAQVRTY